MTIQAIIIGFVIVSISMSCMYLLFGKKRQHWMCWVIGVITGLVASIIKVGG